MRDSASRSANTPATASAPTASQAQPMSSRWTALLVPVTFYNALRQRFVTHKRFARFTFPTWLFVAVSGLVVYVMAVHLYPLNAS